MVYLLWAIAAGSWLLVAASLLSYHPFDAPTHAAAPHNAPAANWVGSFGAAIAYELYLMLGPGVWVMLAAWLAAMVAVAMRKPVTQPIIRVVGVVLMAVSASALVGLAVPIVSPTHMPPGGLVAYFCNNELLPRFNVLGTLLIQLLSFWVGAILAADQLVLALPALLFKTATRVRQGSWPRPVFVGGPAAKSARRRRNDDVDDNGVIDEDAGGPGATEYFDPDAEVDDEYEDEEEYEYEDEDAEVDEAAQDVDEEAAPVEAEKGFDPEELRKKIKQLPINFAPQGKSKEQEIPREVDLSGYKFPPIDILDVGESNFTNEIEKLVREQAIALETALNEYRIDGEVVGIDSGPTITLYEVALAPGTKVSRIQSVSSDLARALKATNIRVVPNMAGRDTIGVEVPNLKKEKVRLRELMGANPDVVHKMHLPMWLGKDASGNPLIADLTSMPHMLIAGTTGSGKSVCMNSIIMSFLFTKRPDELKMVLVDPKMVEMSLFKDIPHLMCPVVTEMARAAAILEWATTKMDERYELLAEAGVRDIASYNSLGWDELKERFDPQSEAEEARIPKKLPYLVFVIDELADLMMTNKDVEAFIVRIAQKARAVGMHLILATQRPQANVVTGLIKGNMPCRISFKVASRLDSRIVLDQSGAELLLGHGDMLFLSPRSSKLTRCQGTFLDDFEIRKVAKFLKDVAAPSFEPQLVQLKSGGGEISAADRDELFEDAVQVVLETQRGSVSLLQRRLSIGYSRASRLIEEIADAGLLGEYKGSQAREVLISAEEWDAMKAQAEADAGVVVNGTLPDEGEVDDEEDGDVPDEFDDEYRQ